ncbi:MAG: hypothetical protein QG622_1347 [Actinomycetota bacterium]|nr:hypothetical protein [Actinomycetota bacterium]
MRPTLPPVPREIASYLLARQALWRPTVRFGDSPVTTCLAAGLDWEAWVSTWVPGRSTGMHDHGDASGVFAVLSGSVEESTVLALSGRRGTGPRNRVVRRRYHAGCFRAFGPHHLHDIEAGTSRHALTLHVHMSPLAGPVSGTRHGVGHDQCPVMCGYAIPAKRQYQERWSDGQR